jgi:chromosome partitioning related protein ParA
VLLLDLDVQPTLSSYYELAQRAPGGIYELLAFNERDLGQLVSRTIIAGLDLVLSNDHRGELNTLLLHAPDGRLRLRHLLPAGAPLRPGADRHPGRARCCWRWRCSPPTSRCRP